MGIVTLVMIAFLLSEVALFLAKRSKKEGVKSQADKRSLSILWATISIGLTAGSFMAGFRIGMFDQPRVAEVVGLVVAGLGFLIRWVAVIQLGKMFTVDVAIANTHRLKSTGLYKLVRHPSYLGLMLIIAGLAISLGSLPGALVVIIPVFLALNYRMVVEEKALEAEFGLQYQDYKKHVARLIPLVY